MKRWQLFHQYAGWIVAFIFMALALLSQRQAHTMIGNFDEMHGSFTKMRDAYSRCMEVVDSRGAAGR